MTIPGQCFNISQGGLYAIVPGGYQVATGQSYNFEMAVAECGPEPGTQQVVSQRGRIVRMDLLLGASGNQLGIGVRLVGPRHGMVPMPS